MSRLTEEMVIARAKESDLSTIKKLNCWGSDLTDASIIKRMRGVEVLALSVNKIATLAHFEDCHKLQELYLRKNNITDINEIRYLQNLPVLKYLWLEENPCCERAGPNYRAVVLRALPHLKKLDNVDVTQEEVDEALRGGGDDGRVHEEEAYGDIYEQQQQQHQQQQRQQHEQQQQQQHYYQQQQYQSASPQNSQSMHQLRRSSNPIKERSPGLPECSSHMGYRERTVQQKQRSISTQSMKEYYQFERPAYPVHYRHSQTDLTEWEEHQRHPTAPHSQYGSQLQLYQQQQRQSARTEREGAIVRYAYRNGNARKNGDWEDANSERPRVRRSNGRFTDLTSTDSSDVVNHFANYHRRPINSNTNVLSSMLCLVKELDYFSLKVVKHAVRCRIDDLATE